MGGEKKLAVGLTYARTVTVTDDMTPGHLRQEPIRVLSTPDMIRLIEQTAIEATQPYLPEGQDRPRSARASTCRTSRRRRSA